MLVARLADRAGHDPGPSRSPAGCDRSPPWPRHPGTARWITRQQAPAERAVRAEPLHLLDRVVADADGQDLPLLAEIEELLGGLFDRHQRIGPVHSIDDHVPACARGCDRLADDLLGAAEQIAPGTGVILLTAYARWESASAARPSGASSRSTAWSGGVPGRRNAFTAAVLACHAGGKEATSRRFAADRADSPIIPIDKLAFPPVE